MVCSRQLFCFRAVSFVAARATCFLLAAVLFVFVLSEQLAAQGLATGVISDESLKLLVSTELCSSSLSCHANAVCCWVDTGPRCMQCWLQCMQCWHTHTAAARMHQTTMQRLVCETQYCLAVLQLDCAQVEPTWGSQRQGNHRAGLHWSVCGMSSWCPYVFHGLCAIAGTTWSIHTVVS